MPSKPPGEIALEIELGIRPVEGVPKYDAANIANKIAAREKFDEFLAAYRRLGTMYHACAEARIGRREIQKMCKEDPALQALFEQADKEFTESLERVCADRALSGKSDLLLMFMLKKRDPSYRENFKMEHSGEVAIRVIRYDDPATPASTALPAPEATPPMIEGQVVEESKQTAEVPPPDAP